MPIIISHKGNITGPNTALYGENHPSSVRAALNQKHHVEVDCWFVNNKLSLGHDTPEYPVNADFFHNDRLWVHCKNIEALYKLRTNPAINAFFHDKDDCTLTTENYIWTYPNANLVLTKSSIAVMPELVDGWNLDNVYGVCTDYPEEYKKKFTMVPIDVDLSDMDLLA